ncbi:unnamed protein product [Chondrus crispus]|uniref:Uncharacterized protein n=1 Tax=Chondrus crispus TaxID=2769 RepID=R7QV02_CHOCR|nr:unnamed protein product [Chondrus crispus]CDF41311.1 unnamed protein product [Chondrus crispus]|eukprot:XP_005711605.1 unnamed protein product [Chondrus crispus]
MSPVHKKSHRLLPSQYNRRLRCCSYSYSYSYSPHDSFARAE